MEALWQHLTASASNLLLYALFLTIVVNIT